MEKEEFILGGYDLTIDTENSKITIIGNKIIALNIKADDQVFDELCEREGFEFGYGLYPPEFYANEINLGKEAQIMINYKTPYDYETALYFMEHNDVEVELRIKNHWVIVSGWTFIDEKKYALSIKMKFKKTSA